MTLIRVYRNPECAKCARFARVLPFVDWFHRVDASTETPRTGALRLGEIAVEELSRSLSDLGHFRIPVSNCVRRRGVKRERSRSFVTDEQRSIRAKGDPETGMRLSPTDS